MNDKQKNILVVILNDIPEIEFDRNKKLTSTQKNSLHLMDEKLDLGINLNEKFYRNPTLEQRIEFVAANLFSALLNDQEGIAAASCAYIAVSLPELKQIKAVEQNKTVSIELIFDREYQTEIKMNFLPLDKITKQH